MALVRPIVGLMLWILFSYMNPHRLAYGFAYSFPWVFICAAVTLFSMPLHPEERQKLPWKLITILLLVFLVWTGITTLNAVEGPLAQSHWIIFLKIQLMAFATLLLVKDQRRMHWILWVIVLSFGFWGFKGGVFTLLTGGHYHVYGPPQSFFADNNDYALVMCMALPLMRYLQLKETRKWVHWGLWGLMGLTALSVLGTYSRGGMLALAAVLFMLAIKSRRRLGLLVVMAAIMPLALTFMPQQWLGRMHTIQTYGSDPNAIQKNESAEGRIQSWEFATHVALAHPFVGGGFRVWASDQMWDEYGPPGAVHRAIHSIFFEVLGEQGFVGLALYLGLIIAGWKALSNVRRRTRDGPETRWMADLASMFQVSIVGYLVGGAFLTRPYLDIFYQLLALTVVLQVMAARTVGETEADKETGSSERYPDAV